MAFSQNITGILFALVAYALFVVGDTFYKYVGTEYSIYYLAFYGKLAATIFFSAYLIIKKQKLVTYFPKEQIIRSIALTINFLCILYAYKSLTLAEVALMYYLCPFIISIFSHFLLKEPVSAHRIISIIIGFTGILIILRPGIIEINTGFMMLFFGVICFCYANILSRIIGDKEPSINFTLFPTVMSMLCVLPLVIMQPLLPPLFDLSMMAAGGTIGGIAIMLISIAYIKTHAVTISILAYTDIFWALLLGYIVFGDITNDPYTIIGGVIIMLSGMYLIYRENKKSVL